MTGPNWADKTIWTGDNLPIMRGMNSESVDLIYLDPPFNSKTDYAAPIGSAAAGAAFKDTWTLSDLDVEWLNLIEGKHPALWRVLLAAMTPSDKSYLVYMAVRLIELRRVLKPTGSIYLHCDPTMSHYLKLLLDAIFGKRGFRNEVIWLRTTGRSDARRFGRVHDVILYYARGEPTWNRQYQAYDAAYVATKYRHNDKDGRGPYRTGDLTGPGMNPNDDSMGDWHPASIGRCWSVPRTGAYAAWIDANLIAGYASVVDASERLALLDEVGLIYWSSKGTPELKRYLSAGRGVAAGDVITDIPPVNSQARERTGYPTQKPLALLRRIIKASSNEGDIVFDPFCGCATTLVAADDLNRQWMGIDISPKAAELVVQRIADRQGLFRSIVARSDIPARTDLGPLPAANSPENRQLLYGQQSGNCAGCVTHFEARHLEVDHIIARTKGGTDHIDNLQLLCGHCNRVKGNRGMEYLRTKLRLAV